MRESNTFLDQMNALLPCATNRSDGAGAELWELAYYSAASFPHGPEDLKALLGGAQARNAALGITGMLIYWNECFFQVLEGPQDAVDHVFMDFIVPARSHSAILTAHSGTLDTRAFEGWSMAWHMPSDTETLCIERLIDPVREGRLVDGAGGIGSSLLRTFVARARTEIGQSWNHDLLGRDDLSPA